MTVETAQTPLVKIGTTFDIGGHKAKVVAICKEHVECHVEGQSKKKPYKIDFDKIEHALKSGI